jgi:hypothetical protein
MHAKRRHRFCGGKIVSIYFQSGWRNKYLYVKPAGTHAQRGGLVRRRSLFVGRSLFHFQTATAI